MQITSTIKQNVLKIVRDCCQLKPGEDVLIIRDISQDPAIAQVFYDAVLEYDGKPSIVIIPTSTPGSPLPATANAAAMVADLILTPTTVSIFHASGLHDACTHGKARLLAISECTAEMLSKGGICADFLGIEPTVKRVAEYYEKGSKIVYSTPAGTRITADISGRKPYLNSCISNKPGDMNGIPTIEVYIAPIENSVNGEIVVDLSCSGGVGKIIEAPIRIRIENGKAVEFSGGAEARKLEAILKSTENPSSFQVAELAIGLNPCCRITGNISEDEGKYGTCHMALGSNASFGGLNPAPIHIDMVLDKPTITIDGIIITKNGDLAV